jgi:hypothetical protein
MKINLKHAATGAFKQVKLGFSWTVLFFGGLVPLFRGDLKWFFIMIFSALITLGLAWIAFPFIYNKFYIRELLEKGYVPADDTSRNQLQSKEIVAAAA